MGETLYNHQTLDSSWGFLCTLSLHVFEELGIAPGDWVKIKISTETRVCKAVISTKPTSDCHSTRRLVLNRQNPDIREGRCSIQKIAFPNDEIPLATSVKIAIVKAPDLPGCFFTDMPEGAPIKSLMRILEGSLVADVSMVIETCDILGTWKFLVRDVEPKSAAMIDGDSTHIYVCGYDTLESPQINFKSEVANLILNESSCQDLGASLNKAFIIGDHGSGLQFVGGLVREMLNTESVINYTITGDTIGQVRKSTDQLCERVDKHDLSNSAIIINCCHSTRHKLVETHLLNVSRKCIKNIVIMIDSADEYLFPSYRFFKLRSLNHPGRTKLLEIFFKYVKADRLLDLSELSSKMNGFSLSDILSTLTLSLAKNPTEHGDFVVESSHITSALSLIKSPYYLRGKTTNASQYSLEEIGGLESIKRRLKCIFDWGTLYSSSFEKLGVSLPHGVLLHGPSGCSKTSLVRAIASTCRMNLFFLDNSKLYSQYFGESEKILRDTFAEARRAAPSIIFIDEIDTIVGRRSSETSRDSSSSNRNSVQDGIISTLLNEMDGISSLSGVTVIGATNRPENVELAIMRPGRFDFLINVPLPDAPDRLEILKVATKLLTLHKNVDLENIALYHTDNYSGADLVSLCKEAAILAIRENCESPVITSDHFNISFDIVKSN